MNSDPNQHSKPISEKQEEVRRTLPEDLVPIFDALVEEYRFFAVIHHRAPFVSYVVLADLVRSGWRPSGEPRG